MFKRILQNLPRLSMDSDKAKPSPESHASSGTCVVAPVEEQVWQTLEPKTKGEQRVDKTAGTKESQNPSSAPASAHYWFCPLFVHHSNCQYVNFAAQDPNYWHSMMANDNHNPSVGSVPAKRIKVENNREQGEKSTLSKPGQPTDRAYSCPLCDQLSHTKDLTLLRRHIEEHLGKQRPFVCTLCKREFKFRSNCRNHLVAHSIVRKVAIRPKKSAKPDSLSDAQMDSSLQF